MAEIQRDKNIQDTYTSNTFALYALGTFLSLTVILFKVDFVPELQIPIGGDTLQSAVAEVNADTKDESQKKEAVTQALISDPALPIRITIDAIGLDTAILNPSSNDIAVLDRALLSGAVHYPGSGLLGEKANVLLFGHSSYLPVVQNKAFKAFNELSKVEVGDVITVFSETDEYTYTVDKVWLSLAEDAQVNFESSKPILTLATCNTFGAKQERWIVTASLVSKKTF